MSFRAANILGAPAGSLVGSLAGYRAIYYVVVFGLILTGGVTVTRKEPLRFAFLALITCFLIAAALVPPGRLGITVFDLVMIALTIGLIGTRMFASSIAAVAFFPTKSLLIAWLLSIPSVAFSQYPVLSLLIFTLNCAVYAFFLFTLNELRREGGFERLVVDRIDFHGHRPLSRPYPAHESEFKE